MLLLFPSKTHCAPRGAHTCAAGRKPGALPRRHGEAGDSSVPPAGRSIVVLKDALVPSLRRLLTIGDADQLLFFLPFFEGLFQARFRPLSAVPMRWHGMRRSTHCSCAIG